MFTLNPNSWCFAKISLNKNICFLSDLQRLPQLNSFHCSSNRFNAAPTAIGTIHSQFPPNTDTENTGNPPQESASVAHETEGDAAVPSRPAEATGTGQTRAGGGRSVSAMEQPPLKHADRFSRVTAEGTVCGRYVDCWREDFEMSQGDFQISRDVTSFVKFFLLFQLILCSCSSYFDEILSAITPLQHPVIFMNNIPFWILKSLCDFMYAGEVHIDQSKLEELLQVAEILKVSAF